ANNLLPAVDSYIGRTAHNYYVYFDTYHGRAVLMPWDLNASFGGNAWLTVTQKQVLSPFYMMGITRPLLNNVVNTTVKGGEWRARYLAHLRTMVNQVYDWKVLGPKVTAYQNLIAAEVQRDSVKLYSNTLFTQNVTQDVLIRVRFSNQWIPGLKPMVDNRRAYLLNHAEIRTAPPVLSGLQHLPTQPTTTDTVWVTVKASTTVAADKVQLYHRVRGAYTEAPMFDDGKHQDGGVGDGIFGASIPKQGYGAAVDYYVSARAKPVSGGAMAFLPDTAAHQPRRYRVLGAFQPLAVVRINEVLADNDNGDRDEGGDRDDWVELINTGTTTYHLSGHYLTDDLNSPKAWQFPQGTTIPAGGFLRIWCDNEPTEGKLHATFKLGKNGASSTCGRPAATSRPPAPAAAGPCASTPAAPAPRAGSTSSRAPRPGAAARSPWTSAAATRARQRWGSRPQCGRSPWVPWAPCSSMPAPWWWCSCPWTPRALANSPPPSPTLRWGSRSMPRRSSRS
ncbi:MAG: lamin tail domain-containing protein, partial [Planctomycetota bacterium]